MVSSIVLTAEDNALLIEADEKGWARCFLVDRERTYLGADDAAIIFTRLLNWLREGDVLGRSVAGELEGLPVFCLLALSEAHHVLYVAASAEDRLLFWENTQMSPVTLAGVMRLSPRQRQQWQAQLEAVRDKSMPLNRIRQIAAKKTAGGAEALK